MAEAALLAGKTDLALCVAGQAGDGIVTTGRLIQRLLFSAGYHVSGSQTVPSRIRGGATALTVRVTDFPHSAPAGDLDLLVAFEPEAVEIHGDRLKEGGLLLFDPGRGDLQDELELPEGITLLELPWRKRAKTLCGKDLYKAGGALGAVACLLDLSTESVTAELERTFHGKAKAVAANLRMAKEGNTLLDEALMEHGEQAAPWWPLKKFEEIPPRLLMTANHAIALGAIAAGCRFVAGYPITPATEILTHLIRELPAIGGRAIQAEDELAAVNMCTGAAWGGARAMTCTSGPGFSLMAEGLGFAANAEVGFVVADVQRPGPSTGMPTRTEQGDLNHAVFAGHGTFERIVLSPANAEEAFYQTAEAFNLADEYQCPVFLLTQQHLGQNNFTIDRLDLDRISIDRGELLPLEPIKEPTTSTPDNGSTTISEDKGVNRAPPGWYPRFQFTDSGISTRVLPGTPGGIHLLNANEHGPSGHISYSPLGRNMMVEKRAAKLETLNQKEASSALSITGNSDPQFTVVGWGATHGAIAEACSRLSECSGDLRHVHFKRLWPLPQAKLEELFSGNEPVVVVENNQDGQLARLLRATFSREPNFISLARYDGLMFTGRDLARRLKEEVLQ